MKAIWIVLDGVGAGELPDAATYGDVGSDTLGNLARAVGGLRLPNLARLGLGNLHSIAGVAPARSPLASYGRMQERSPGKDSTSGHWELAGLLLERPFPTYPQGFPVELVRAFEARVGRQTIGNVVASGTAIIEELGDLHVKTGYLILYTSADSVFQIAAHEEVVPLAELYRICEAARAMLIPPHGVGRVIARPFVGRTGEYRRTAGRRDFSLEPPGPTLLDRLTESSVPVFGVGKVGELFAHRGFVDVVKTTSNDHGIHTTIRLMKDLREGLIFVNLVDFDTAYGHRNDPAGFAAALERFDEALEEIVGRTEGDDLLAVTADHGNDPTTPSTDHSREHVPLLVRWPRGRAGVDLGVRESFADLGATLADYFHVRRPPAGTSFLGEIR
jgi:phosphopentomutase